MTIGRVKWFDKEKGAFVEEMGTSSQRLPASRRSSVYLPSQSVFIPPEAIGAMVLKEGQLVKIEVSNQVATKLEMLNS